MGKDVRKDLATRDLGRALGKKIARLERHVRELEVASQGAFRSVEDGSIDWYDEDGVLRERVGKQADGSYGRKTFTGDIPPAPTEPDVVVISDGVVAVTWDGRWEERYSHVGWRNVQIHMSDDLADMPGDRDTQVGAIFASRGGTVVAVTESDDDNPVYVWLVGTNDAGQTGDPSVAVLVDELDEDDLEEEQEELEWEDRDGWTLTAADITAGTVTFGLSHIPEQRSLLAWWHPGGLAFAGVPQDPDVYSIDYDAQTVTWVLTPDLEEVGDRLRVYYAYLEGEPTAVSAYTTGVDNPIVPPASAEAGSLLLLAITLPEGHAGATDLNGYTLIGQTDLVSHTVGNSSGGIDPALTYRMAVFARSAPGGSVPVPTFAADVKDTVYVFAALPNGGGSVLTSAFGTANEAGSATTPALTGANIHLFATLGEYQTINAPGIEAEFNHDPQINIVICPVTTDDLTATVQGTAAWMYASLKVEGL